MAERYVSKYPGGEHSDGQMGFWLQFLGGHGRRSKHQSARPVEAISRIPVEFAPSFSPRDWRFCSARLATEFRYKIDCDPEAPRCYSPHPQKVEEEGEESLFQNASFKQRANQPKPGLRGVGAVEVRVSVQDLYCVRPFRQRLKGVGAGCHPAATKVMSRRPLT